jgi:hypothetical protein
MENLALVRNSVTFGVTLHLHVAEQIGLIMDIHLGKTTLVSSVIDRFLDQAAELRDGCCSISFFYLKHDQPDKRTHKGLLRAVLDQLITQDASLSHELLDEFSSIDSCQLSIERLGM